MVDFMSQSVLVGDSVTFTVPGYDDLLQIGKVVHVKKSSAEIEYLHPHFKDEYGSPAVMRATRCGVLKLNPRALNEVMSNLDRYSFISDEAADRLFEEGALPE
jgi:hypothetical protein